MKKISAKYVPNIWCQCWNWCKIFGLVENRDGLIYSRIEIKLINEPILFNKPTNSTMSRS